MQPWTVYERREKTGELLQLDVRQGDTTICGITLRYPPKEEIHLDRAHLIAAAPETHDALFALFRACLEAREELPPSIDGTLLDQARRALDKADGR